MLMVPSTLPVTEAFVRYPVSFTHTFKVGSSSSSSSNPSSTLPRSERDNERGGFFLSAAWSRGVGGGDGDGDGRGKDETDDAAYFRSNAELEAFVAEFERDHYQHEGGRAGGASSRPRADRANKYFLSMLRRFSSLVVFASTSWFLLPFLSGLDFLYLSETARSAESYAVFAGLDSLVIGGLSITLGTLVSMSVSVLRQRQQDVRRCLSQEAALLEATAQQHVKLFRRDKARLRRSMQVLTRYVGETRRSIAVSIVFGCDGVPAYWRRHWNGQKENVVEMLDVLGECGDHALAGPTYGFAPTSSSNTLLTCETLLVRLNDSRAERRSVLESTLPGSLYGTIVALMSAILFCFLLRADTVSAAKSAVTLRDFLSETPVRTLFVVMSSSFFSLLQILSDLRDPFDGAFRVDPSVVDLAQARAEGALALAVSDEEFEEGLLDQAYRPDMRGDDDLAPKLFY